jgi:uncharacterized protein
MHRVLSPGETDPDAQGRCALAVMTKAPVAGQVKTRLIPPLNEEEAAQLNICFLRDTAAAISTVAKQKASGIAVYTPAGAEAAYDDILGADFQLLVQRGESFGERLTFAVQDLFKIGFASVCLIDSDSPTVRAEVYAKAVDELAKPGERVVIGPSDDGGYYLIGLKRFHCRMFERIEWSTERVLEQTKRRAAELGLEVKLLAAGYDVDDETTLRRLCAELLGEASGRVAERAPNTAAFLRALVARCGDDDRIWHGVR